MVEEIPVYAAPGRETDLKGMPPACSIVGDLEPVKDETVLYFTRMKKADVPVSLRVYHGCFHSFESTAVNSSVALNAQRYLVDSFRYAQKHYYAHNEEPEEMPESTVIPEPEIPAPAEAAEETPITAQAPDNTKVPDPEESASAQGESPEADESARERE